MNQDIRVLYVSQSTTEYYSKASLRNSKLRPNDQVRILIPVRQGFFTMRQVRNGKCMLLDQNGALVDSGEWSKESDLELEGWDFLRWRDLEDVGVNGGK